MKTIRTAEKRQRFLDELTQCGNVRETCRRLRLSRDAVYRWRAEDEAFANEWDIRLGLAAEILEGEARRRAMEGSDRLLMFLLQGLKSEVYGRRAAVTVPRDHHDKHRNMSLPEMRQRLDELRRLQDDASWVDDTGRSHPPEDALPVARRRRAR